jgi:hypothetical protein
MQPALAEFVADCFLAITFAGYQFKKEQNGSDFRSINLLGDRTCDIHRLTQQHITHLRFRLMFRDLFRTRARRRDLKRH